jgi:hypothetical protein
VPVYDFDGERVRRKNTYMPCIIGPKFDQASPAEQARIFKATYWADNIANREWQALLGEEGFDRSAKSRLKKKAAGWLIALARIYYLNPELFEQIAKQAAEAYSEQVEDDSFLLQTVHNIANLTVEAEGRWLNSQVWRSDEDTG